MTGSGYRIVLQLNLDTSLQISVLKSKRFSSIPRVPLANKLDRDYPSSGYIRIDLELNYIMTVYGCRITLHLNLGSSLHIYMLKIKRYSSMCKVFSASRYGRDNPSPGQIIADLQLDYIIYMNGYHCRITLHLILDRSFTYIW